MTETTLYVVYDPETFEIINAQSITRKAKVLDVLVLPENSIDLSSNPSLFESVKSDPRRYVVIDGELVEVQE